MSQSFTEELARVPMAPNLVATLTRAADYAREQNHPRVTLEHMLLALTQDADAPLVLQASGVAIDRLTGDVVTQLASIEPAGPEAGAGSLAIGTDLKRVLEAAAAAAQQGRRQVSGAIVLAAIVGEGKSTAAQILRAHGLTFEHAIKALQQSARGQPARPAAAAPPHRQSEPTRAGPEPVAQAPAAPQDTTQHPVHTQPPSTKPPPLVARVSPAKPPQTAPAAEPPPAAAPPSSPPPVPPRQHPPVAPPPPRAAAAAPPSAMPSPPPQAASQPPTAPVAQSQPSPPRNFEPDWGPAGLPQAGDIAQLNEQSRPIGDGYAQESLHRPMLPPDAAAMPPDPLPAHPSAAPDNRYEMPPSWPPPPPPAPPVYPNEPAHYGQSSPAQAFGTSPRYDDANRYPPEPPPQRTGRELVPRRPPPGADTAGGQLIENIPRLMRSQVPVIVEVRLVPSSDSPLPGYGTAMLPARAMTVRLSSPDSSFRVDAMTTETQWIDAVTAATSQSMARWRWTVTPEHGGRNKLHLSVSARWIGPNGISDDIPMPVQLVTVDVRRAYGRAFKKAVGWLLAVGLGAALSSFAAPLWLIAVKSIRQLTGP